MEKKELGKITNVSFGRGGYQDAMLGINFSLEGSGWGVCDYWGFWEGDPDKYHEWTLGDQTKYWGEMVRKIGKLLADAKRSDVSSLAGVPIEVTFNGVTLQSWRILTEVL